MSDSKYCDPRSVFTKVQCSPTGGSSFFPCPSSSDIFSAANVRKTCCDVIRWSSRRSAASTASLIAIAPAFFCAARNVRCLRAPDARDLSVGTRFFGGFCGSLRAPFDDFASFFPDFGVFFAGLGVFFANFGTFFRDFGVCFADFGVFFAGFASFFADFLAPGVSDIRRFESCIVLFVFGGQQKHGGKTWGAPTGFALGGKHSVYG